MKKIILIGCPGSGKTTLATKLGSKLNIPIHHLDKYFWKENRKHLTQEEFREVQDDLMATDTWILDGNFTKSIDNRIVNADTVIFLDFPKALSLFRYVKRYINHFGTVRNDMGGGNTDTLQWKFIKFVLTFPKEEIYSMIKEYSGERKVYILKNQKEVDIFLNNATSQ